MIVHPVEGLTVKPTLTGTNVVLRPFAFEQDAPALREMLQDPEVIKLTGSSHDSVAMPEWDAAAESAFRDWYSTRNDQTRPTRSPSVLGAGERSSASARSSSMSGASQTAAATSGRSIGPRGQDRGLGTEAIRLFLCYGFERLGLRRISLDVLNFNPRAKRVYEKLGFVTEGVLR